MKPYEKYINSELITHIKDNVGKNGKIPKEFKGYIASFGASVMQSGLIPTLAFFSKKAGAEEDRSALLTVIQKALGKEKKLFEVALELKNDPPRLAQFQRQVLNVAIAVKLALRTFQMESDDKKTPAED